MHAATLSFMREPAALIIVMICAALISGCTAQTTSQKTTPPATQVETSVIIGPTEVVHVTATSFDPDKLYVRAGTTVTWRNDDRMSRHVVHLPREATGRELFNSGSLSPGDSFSYTFTKPGRYVYGDPQHGGGRGEATFVNVTD